MKKWDASFKNALLEARNYRQFLALFFSKEANWSYPRSLSYGQFAQQAGFRAKSFMNEVIAGRKRLTPSSVEQVIKGLRLPATWAEYFKTLVASEESDVAAATRSSRSPAERLSYLKSRIQKSLETKPTTGSDRLVEAYLLPDAPEIFAALGELTRGATLSEVVQRTKLEQAKVTSTLSTLLSSGLITYQSDTNSYVPNMTALESEALGHSQVFRADFFRSLDKVRKRLDRQLTSTESLFMTQTLSVSSAQLPEFKQQLAELIRQFATEIENPTGDTVAEICIAMTRSVSDTKVTRNPMSKDLFE